MTSFPIVSQILLAITAALLISKHFNSVYNEEYQRDLVKDESPYGRDTIMWYAPSVIIYPLIFIISAFRLKDVTFDIGLALSALNFALLISIYYLSLLLVSPMLKGRITERALYLLWTLPPLFFAVIQSQGLAFSLSNELYLFKINIPTLYLQWFLIIWLVGALLIGAYFIISHQAFLSKLKKSRSQITNEQSNRLLKEISEKLNYKREISLYESSSIESPLSVGASFSSKSIYLPQRHYSTQDLEMIFTHEIHHLQRRDIDQSMSFAVLKSFMWFNPFLWIATREATESMELAVDEVMANYLSEHEKKKYMELLINHSGRPRGFSTHLSMHGHKLKNRLQRISGAKKKNPGTSAIFVAIIFCSLLRFLLVIGEEKITLSDTLFQEERTTISTELEDLETRELKIVSIEQKILEEVFEETTVKRYLFTKPENNLPDRFKVTYMDKGSKVEGIISNRLLEIRTEKGSYYYALDRLPNWQEIYRAVKKD